MEFVLFLIVVVLSSGAGLSLARLLHWRSQSTQNSLFLAVGLGLGPLLTGLATMVVVWCLPRADATFHLALVLGFLAVSSVPGLRSFPTAFTQSSKDGEWQSRLIVGVIVLSFFVLIADVLLTPLVQNDALEYATVGRIVFEAGDLRVYPVIHPEASASGFFAPWTHPPLYVALGYLSFAIQGNADNTDIFRLMAPWCFLVTVICVRALGRQISKRCGEFSALICLSLPMLYLGSASAQIDAVAVLGFTLCFLTATSVEGSVWRLSVSLGAMLGIALWTHSQAIIFPALTIPLLLLNRWREFSLLPRLLRVLKSSVIVVFVTLSVGAAPYVRNVSIFGSPISDNPAVFAFPSLGWSNFFQLQRGLAHVEEIIAYGIFKGFVAVEIFSITFWLALLAVPVLLSQQKEWFRKRAGGSKSPEKNLINSSLVVIGIYLLGASLSVLIGTDVMIRNERYMLVLAPCLALAGAGALDHSLDLKGMLPSGPKGWIFTVSSCLLCLQLVALDVYRLRSLAVDSHVTENGPMDYLRDNTPADATVLALRPADMFYSKRKMISYLDPRMLDFYGQTDLTAAARELRKLQIDFVQVPDYTLPPFYNSQLMELLAQTDYAQLVYERAGYQIYRLLDGNRSSTDLPRSSITFHGWQKANSVMFGGGGQIGSFELGSEDYVEGASTKAWNSTLLLRRITVTRLRSKAVSLSTEQSCGNAEEAKEFELALKVSGEGFVDVFVDIIGAGVLIERKSLGGIPVSDMTATTRFSRRILISKAASELRLDVLFRPIANIALRGAELRLLCERRQF